MQHMPQFVFPILVKKIMNVAASLPACKGVDLLAGGLSAPTTLIQAVCHQGKEEAQISVPRKNGNPLPGQGEQGHM